MSSIELRSMGIMAACCGLAFTCISAAAQFAGPSVASPAKAAEAPLAAQQIAFAESQIAAGDIVSIITVGAPELTVNSSVVTRGETGGSAVSGLRLGAQGEVTLPYVGTVKLLGMKPSQAAAYLRQALMDAGVLSDPQVVVTIVDSPSRTIAVLGMGPVVDAQTAVCAMLIAQAKKNEN